MKKPQKVLVPIIILLVFLCLLCLCPIIYLYDQLFVQKIIVTNESDQNLQSVEISYCDEKLILKDLKNSQSVTKKVTIDCDSSFDVKITLENGFKLKESIDTYVTNSDASKNEFVINEDLQLEYSQNTSWRN